jgi:adenosylcobinamide-phosphate guanylyltransferase
VIAAIMCGGRATRIKSDTEKPLLKVGGRPMVERVYSALEGSFRFGRIVAAVSANTPETKKFLAAKGIEVIETAGEGFSQDLQHLLSKLKPERVFVIPADVPLVNPQTISDVADLAGGERAPAVSIVMENKFVNDIGAKPSVMLDDKYCHSGITIFDTSAIGSGEVEEEYLLMNRKEIAVNVNTKEEKELAELLVQRAQDFA